MAKIIEIEILTDLAAGKELSNDRVLGESFAKLLDRRMVAFDGRPPSIMPAGRAYLDDEKARADRARKARNASAGVDVGPVRGAKRLAGPQICASQKRSAELYAQLSKAVCLARFAARAS